MDLGVRRAHEGGIFTVPVWPLPARSVQFLIFIAPAFVNILIQIHVPTPLPCTIPIPTQQGTLLSEPFLLSRNEEGKKGRCL